MSTLAQPIDAQHSGAPLAMPQPASTTPGGQTLSLHLTRILRTTPEQAFNAWTQPALLRQWFGPDGWDCYEASGNPVVGETFTAAMRGIPPNRPEAGVVESRVEGTYRELIPYSLIVFSWRGCWRPAEEQTIVTLRLTPVEGGTLLELTHAGFLDQEGVDGHSMGWNGSLDKLATFVSRG